jgi:phytoene synthase
MNASSEDKTNDRLFCWEQVSRTNPAFRVSQVYASREDADRLLPLYTLFSIIEQICGRSSDEDLARSKLSWWRIECSPENLQKSRHPVLKEMHRTGVAERLEPAVVKQLLDGAEIRLEARPPSDISELKNMCADFQNAQYSLESMACGLRPEQIGVNRSLLARNGLLQLIRESSQQAEQGAYWWIPLNLLARHGVSRGDVINDPKSAEVSALMTGLLTESKLWVQSSPNDFQDRRGVSALRNFFAISGLYAKKINKLQEVCLDRYITELARIRVSDLFIAWKCARRLQA